MTHRDDQNRDDENRDSECFALMFDLRKRVPWRRVLMGPLLLCLGLLPLLTSCDLPQVKAEDRLFLPLEVEFLGAYQLPKQDFQETTVGGLSAIAYDRQRDRLYALSDDRGRFGPPRFYTLKLEVNASPQPSLQTIEIESVTPLRDETGNLYPVNTIDPEGIGLSPRETVFISSEGVDGAASPAIAEFDLTTGQLQQRLPIPDRYLPGESDISEVGEKGILDNLGFESLTINPVGMASPMVEPFRLFTATESSLAQDLDPTGGDPAARNRFLHYLIGEDQVTFISEHLYPLDPDPLGTVLSGLTDLLVLDQGGHFLALERTFGLQGFDAKLYQISTGGATDISNRLALKGDITGISPIRKQLLLHFKDLGITLDNLEGMTLGPRLSDGSQSLLMMSDDNFSSDQITQVLLLRLQSPSLS